MKNANSSLLGELSSFTNFTLEAVHEITAPLYQKQSRYPLDEDTMRFNSIISSSLYLSYKGIKPSTYVAYGLEKEDQHVNEFLSWQILFFDEYEKRRTLEEKIEAYCNYIEAALRANAFRKSEGEFVLIPSYLTIKKKIFEEIISMNTEFHCLC